jgi:probable F420-dependent oxidoreductase
MERSATQPVQVGLFVWSVEGTLGGQTPRWLDLLAMTQRAEQLGFASLWLGEHFTLPMRDGDVPEDRGWWECWSLLAALAARTTTLTLGPLVSCTSYHNPAQLAKVAATVDEISGGRLILGLGAGWYDPETRAFGFPTDHRFSRFAEAVQIIHGLFHQERLTFAGTYHQVENAVLRPRSLRAGGPPLLIGANGPRMLRLAARYADAWNAGWCSQSARAASLCAAVDQACRDLGREPRTLQRTVGVLVDVPGDQPSDAWMRAWRASEGVIAGTPAEIADAIRGFARLGISHVQIALEPHTVAGIEAFAPVLEILRRG